MAGKGVRVLASRFSLWASSVVVVVLVILTSSALAGPQTAISTDQTTTRIALFGPVKNSYVDAVVKGAKAQAKRSRASVDVFISDFDAQKQATQIQDAIASRKYQAFIVYPVDSAGVVPFVQEALRAGIKVAAETSVVGKSLKTKAIQVRGMSSSAANPPYLDGKSAGLATIQACRGLNPCKVIHLAGNFAFGYDVGFRDGLQDALKGQSRIRIVATPQGQYQADPAYNAMRDSLQANDDVNVITSTSDVMIGGAERAVKDAGLALGGARGVRLIGNGGSTIAQAGLKARTWYASIVWLPLQSSSFNVRNLVAAVRKQPIARKAVYTTADLSPIGILMTRANANKFKAQWTGS